MSNIDFKNLHKQYSDFYGNGYKNLFGYKLREKLLLNVLQKIKTDKKISILDAGCGNGYLFKNTFLKTFPNIEYSLGIDFLPEAIEKAKSIFHDVKVGDVTELSKLTEKEFDIVNSTEVFYNISPEKREIFLKEHIERMKKGGFFVLTVPNLESIYRKFFRPDPNFFKYKYSYQTVINLIEKFPEVELINVYGINAFFIVNEIKNNILKINFSYVFTYLIQKR